MDRLEQRLEKCWPELCRRNGQPLQPIRTIRKPTPITTIINCFAVPLADHRSHTRCRRSRNHRWSFRNHKKKAGLAEPRKDSAFHSTAGAGDSVPSITHLLLRVQIE